jgi:hypothetical protein
MALRLVKKGTTDEFSQDTMYTDPVLLNPVSLNNQGGKAYSTPIEVELLADNGKEYSDITLSNGTGEFEFSLNEVFWESGVLSVPDIDASQSDQRVSIYLRFAQFNDGTYTDAFILSDLVILNATETDTP